MSTDLQITNMVLRRLGDSPVAATTEQTTKARLVAELYATVRQATLAAHPWNFAVARRTLLAYTVPDATLTPGTGATVVDTTGVSFTASAAVFASTDVGKVLDNVAGAGLATITAFSSTTVVSATITEAFPSLSAIAAEDWRLNYAPPAWGRGYTIPKPADALRVWRLEDATPYEVETDGTQEVIVTDQASINARVITDVTDPTRFTPLFVTAFVSHLVAMCAEPITGQQAKGNAAYQLYELTLKRARTMDGMEGSAEVVASRDLINVRSGGSTDSTRAWRR